MNISPVSITSTMRGRDPIIDTGKPSMSNLIGDIQRVMIKVYYYIVKACTYLKIQAHNSSNLGVISIKNFGPFLSVLGSYFLITFSLLSPELYPSFLAKPHDFSIIHEYPLESGYHFVKTTLYSKSLHTLCQSLTTLTFKA